MEERTIPLLLQKGHRINLMTTGSANVFGPKSVVTRRATKLVGCSVIVSYTIQG